MKLKTDSQMFRYVNLARAASREVIPQDFRDKLSMLDRDVRFEIYNEVDKEIIVEATRLLKEQGGEIEDKFYQAAINVYSNKD